MSTVAEIEAALPQLGTDQLLRVEQAVHQQFRQRGEIRLVDSGQNPKTNIST